MAKQQKKTEVKQKPQQQFEMVYDADLGGWIKAQKKPKQSQPRQPLQPAPPKKEHDLQEPDIEGYFVHTQLILMSLLQDYAEAMAKIEGATPDSIELRVLSRMRGIQEELEKKSPLKGK